MFQSVFYLEKGEISFLCTHKTPYPKLKRKKSYFCAKTDPEETAFNVPNSFRNQLWLYRIKGDLKTNSINQFGFEVEKRFFLQMDVREPIETGRKYMQNKHINAFTSRSRYVTP